MKPTIEQIEEAIDDYICNRTNELIPYALRVLKGLMGEPSVLMETSGGMERRDQDFAGYKDTRIIFKAMRDQLLKEVDYD